MFNDKILITNIVSIINFSSTQGQSHDYSGTLSCNELIFKLDGSVRIKYGDMLVDEKENSIRFLPKTDIYTIYNTTTLETGSCIDIFFETQEPVKVKPFFINAQKNKELSKLFRKAESIWRSKPNGYIYSCIGLLYEIIGALQNENLYINKLQYDKIKPGVDYINQNFIKSFPLDIASEKCNISYTYFKRIFIQSHGMSPKAYILQMRINYACDLLKTRRYSIGETAELSGFSNVYYFSRIFKNIVGITPTEYKNNYF